MRNKSFPGLGRSEIFRRCVNEDGSAGTLISPILMVYKHDGEIPERIMVKPHGNSLGNLSFFPATHELLDGMRQAVTDNPDQRPSHIFYQVTRASTMRIIHFSAITCC